MENKLRVLQMIDSLSIGGAERVSVNYANALSQVEECESYHCSTRDEGMLKEFLLPDVNYFFMDKKSFLDKLAYKKLISFVKENKINIIHAHSSSFFAAMVVKVFTGVKIVWHDHYGRDISTRSIHVLKFSSLFFSYIISVNNNLKEWAEDKLLISKHKIMYMPNYADLSFDGRIPELPGSEGKRIIVLANLRPQKDHLNMLQAFNKVLENGHKDWSLLFVGRDWKDEYSHSLKKYIQENNMHNNVFILGGRSDTAQILKHCDIGVLSSESEGLPVSLLEYALASLAVICTDVGECAAVTDDGKVAALVPAKDENSLATKLLAYIEDESLREMKGDSLSKYVKANYSKQSVVENLIKVYTEL